MNITENRAPYLFRIDEAISSTGNNRETIEQ